MRAIGRACSWENLFTPGGLALTQRMGNLLDLRSGQRVLDAASGAGASAVFMAQHFGCEVVGVDYSAELVSQARLRRREAGLERHVTFQLGDSEGLPFPDDSFDAVICECSLCTFPDKRRAAREFARVLRPGGRVGLSDVTRNGSLPPELTGLLARVACIADALPLNGYAELLEQAGLRIDRIEPHPEVLRSAVRNVRAGLVGAEWMLKAKQLQLPGVDLAEAKHLAARAAEAVEAGMLGYGLLVGTLPPPPFDGRPKPQTSGAHW